MQFYVYLNGVRRGPLPEARVQTLLDEGVLVGSDLAAETAEGPWKSLSSFLRFSAASSEPFGDKSPPPIISAEPFILPVPEVPRPKPPPEAEAHHTLVDGVAPLPIDALGPYARATLAPNERAFHKTSLHWIVFARFAGMALLVFLFVAMPFAIGLQIFTGSQLGWFVLPLPAFILVPPTLAFASSELVVTDRRVLIKTGVVHRLTLEMFIPRIESVGVDQGFLGRMFDYGTVTIRGTGGSDEPFEAIAQPLEFRNAVQRVQSAPAPMR